MESSLVCGDPEQYTVLSSCTSVKTMCSVGWFEDGLTGALKDLVSKKWTKSVPAGLAEVDTVFSVSVC